MNSAYRINSISHAYLLLHLPKPMHPLIGLIDNLSLSVDPSQLPNPHVLNFYKISYRARFNGKLMYGQGYYDFDEGGLLFAAPNQVVGNKDYNDDTGDKSGYTLLIHPDFFLGYPIARHIKQYGFFSYTANEALHLSDKEKETIIAIFKFMEEELNSRIDDFSQPIMISQIELLLNYANRFYKRQFLTRKAVNSELLQKLDDILEAWFTNETSLNKGIPTVQYLAEQVKLSPNYVSDMLRSLIGQNAQQYIHTILIEKAKEKLSVTRLSVSEVAYNLGFEYPQSFSKLFKAKTNLSPIEFRRLFN